MLKRRSQILTGTGVLAAAALGCIVHLDGKAQVVRGADVGTPAVTKPVLDVKRRLTGTELLEDLEQFRSILHREWILSNLTDIDLDRALDNIAVAGKEGMTLAELTLSLQRVLSCGADGHAGMGELLAVTSSVPGVYADFIVDVCGDGYIAYVVDSTPKLPNAHGEYRFRALKEGYPRLLSIDGVPMATWVKAASRYVPQGPELSVRWRSMRLLQYLPFMRRELHLPAKPTVRVRLVSDDQKREVEFDAPTNQYPRWNLQVPKPNWQILRGEVGCIRFSDVSSHGTELLLTALPQLGHTRGLIIDMRGNEGGAGFETLQVLASYLLPLDTPRKVVGRIIQWQGAASKDDGISANVDGLSSDGKGLVTDFLSSAAARWQPASQRPTESTAVFLARAEAEPRLAPYSNPMFPKSIPYYDRPVVVLFDHRCFSAAEIILLALRQFPNITLVGSANTRAGAGSPESFMLRKSGLTVSLATRVFLPPDGAMIDGHGIRPDVLIEPDADYYMGASDRILDKALDVLEAKTVHSKQQP